MNPETTRKQPENTWRQELRRSRKSTSCEPEAFPSDDTAGEGPWLCAKESVFHWIASGPSM